jgi:hypothetical protein
VKWNSVLTNSRPTAISGHFRRRPFVRRHKWPEMRFRANLVGLLWELHVLRKQFAEQHEG